MEWLDLLWQYALILAVFWCGWLTCCWATRSKGSAREQAADDAEQMEFLHHHFRRRAP